MNAEDSLKLARRFIGLPLEKRQLFLQALQKEGVDFSRFPIPAGVETEDRQALSYAQQRMWFLWQLDPASGAYNLPGAVRLKGVLSLPAMEQAFASLVARHETLRTVFQRQADERLAQVARMPELAVEQTNLSHLAVAEREQAVIDAATRQSLLPFDLENGPLLRVQLLKLDEHEHVLLLTLHHIVSDGWSMNVLIDEFIRCYDAHERGEAPQLPALPIQYSDYALWQRRWLEAGERARQLEYWQARLGDEQPVLELPTDRPRPAMPSYQGTRHDFAIDPALAAQLRSCAQQHNVTLFMLLLGAFNVLLHRYTGQGDIRIGVPIANRNRSEVEGLIGFFVNTQVLRTELTGQTRVAELLQGIKEHALGAQDHQELPFERLVEALKVERSLSHTPLFQVMYNHQPVVADIASVSTASGLELSLVQWQGRTTQFDLTLDTFEKSGTLHAALTYANDLFDAPSIARMARHWISLLQAMVADGEQRVGELPMLVADEQRVLVQDWNQTAKPYPTDCAIHHLIEQQVQRTPQAPALLFGTVSLTYGQLDARANRLAHALRAQGVGADSLVGICVERSIEMVVGLLAILKAGGAYVPLDPEYPRERLAYMIEDSGIRLLLSQHSLLPSLPAEGIQVIALDQPAQWLDGYSDESPAVEVHALNLAYVIYTSGSTGKPKGAGNSHRALVNRLCWMQQAYGLDDGDAVLQKTPFSFDVSVWEFFWPLMTGARLVVAAPGEHREPARLIETIGQFGITTLHFVPSMLQAFIHETGVQACTSLKRIVCSGEALPLDAQLQVFAKLPGAGLFNLYGPTEAAIDVTHWTCVDEGRDAVPIGRPIANLGTYVLDAQLNPVPAGVAGELYLGGVGLARSYHRRPALTAERFVPSPFVSGERLYRTGDRVRQRADGVIDYLGRLDHQVKLRGLRIELGEIETRLMQHPQVREAVVLVQGGKQLVAYLVLEAEQPSDLKAWLLGSLPEYMVPTHIVPLAKLPVTANGKLDRKALPVPDAAPQQAYSAPENALQITLASIWSDVLGVKKVGLDDNFFELGGDSIISIQVVSRARQAGIRLSPRDLFQYQSVRSLALVARHEQATVIDQGPVTGEVILTPVQQGFFAQAIPARHHWNQSLLLTPRQALEPTRLGTALTRLINHHDALRLRFVPQGGSWQQRHVEPITETPLWQRHAADDTELAALCDDAQRSLDLEQGPLLRAALVQMADGTQRLLLVVHHLVVDGVSWRILLEDLQQAYRDSALPAKTSAYQHWAQRLQAHAQRLDDQLPYWQAQSVEADLPCDNPQGGLQNRLGSKLEIRFSAEQTRQLLQDAPVAYRTQVNDLLLTALARVISRWSGQSAALIQLEGHGREDLFDDIDLTRTVGWFTSLFPVRLQAGGELGDAIKSVKEQLRAVPDKGLGYGLLRYLGSDEARASLAGQAVPRITFNYLGQFDRQFDESALFVPAAQGSGQAQDPEAPLANWLTVEGQVYGGELALQWGFSREMFQAPTLQQLADDYRQELLALIEHCVDPQQGGFTPSDVALAQLTQPQLDALDLPAREVQDLYPLSPMQQGMLFHSLYQQGSDDIYVSQLRADIHGLDVARFQQAWAQVLARHDMLRSGFVWQETQAQPLQAVHREVTLPFAEYDWQTRSDQHAALEALSESTRAQGFALERAPLLSLKLVRLGADHFHLIYTNHHILLDGWSRAQLFGEVLQHYSGRPLAPVQGHYREYIDWLQAQDASVSEAFWKAQLARLPAPTLLAPGASPEPSAAKGSHLVTLTGEQTAQLKACAQAHKVTLNTLVQAAWALLLQRQTGQQSVVFGATVSGRPAALPGVEQQVGLFINTLPVIATPCPQQWVGEWLQQVQAHNLSLREHEHTPLFDIQRWAGAGGAALFDTLLVFENYPVSKALAEGATAGLTFSQVQNFEQTHYPLTVLLGAGASLEFEFSFDAQLFSQAQIRHLAGSFQRLLHGLAGPAPQRLGDLSSLDEAERQQVLSGWNATERDYPQGQWVHQLFEAHAQAQPDALALVFGQQRLNYAEVNRRANRLAHRLIEAGVGPDVLVGLAVERSIEMVIGLLAVLKAGGAYVPLDPEYPRERLAYMLDDSGVKLLLTQAHLLEQLPIPAGLHTLVLGDSAFEDYSDANPGIELDGENLAYVIYTSGSTGQPKGAGNRHSALLNRLQWMQEAYELDISDSVLQKTPFSFDVSVWEFFWPLMTGSRLVVAAPGDHRDPAKLVALINQEQITTLHFVPSMLQAFLQDPAVSTCQTLQRIVCSGEALPVDAQQQVFAKLPQAGLYNLYGPTEAAIDVTHWTCVDEDRDAVPIGRPIANLGCYILDSNFEPVPVGVLGELYLGGVGLARGYHRRPSLTAERFIAHPFVQGERLYRTGDLARFREDGVIEYAGRIDHQVKLRGLRIELGEIEARLLEHDWVRETAVLAVDGKFLVGYLVLQNAGEDWRDVLSAHLVRQLPDYMVPAQWMLLEQMPLSPNGKLDRKALPKVDANLQAREYVAPASELEQQIAAIWADVLDVERVGLDDNFFELGGHSLLATQVISRTRHGLGLDVGLKALFDQPVLGAFVQALSGARLEHSRIERVERGQPLVLSYAQERQWFLWQLDPHSAAYHIPSALRLKGALDRDALQRAFDTLLMRHESLRTHLQQDGDRTVQVISARARIEVVSFDASEAHLKAQVEAQITQPFDLRQGPLMRVSLLRLAEDEHVLVLVQHHIVSDGWSMQVMVDELVRLYTAYSQGQALRLPELPIQYADYAVWQRDWMEAGERARQLDYWREQLGGVQPVLELPFDHQRPAVPTHRGARLNIPLATALLEDLKALAQREGVTLFMLLLASYQVLLHRYSGQQDIRVGVPIANRNRMETEGLIGFFVNTQVLKAEIDGQTSVAQLLAQVKQRALEAQSHQDLPFEQLVEALQPERSLSLSPLFQVAFNHHISRAGSHLQRLGQLDISPVAWDEAAAQFDLTLDIEESVDQLRASLSYATDLFEPTTIARMARHWQNLLQAMVADQQQSIGRLNLLDADEQQHILQLWNGTDSGFPATRFVHELFGDRARENPDAVAVKFDTQTLSYGELERQANRLAHALIARGVGPEVRVA
ncbi:amino acid adenylation domain-containing protein, partial [Pseudomonas sp. SDO5222_S391]